MATAPVSVVDAASIGASDVIAVVGSAVGVKRWLWGRCCCIVVELEDGVGADARVEGIVFSVPVGIEAESLNEGLYLQFDAM